MRFNADNIRLGLRRAFWLHVFHVAQTVFLLMKSAVASHDLIEEKVSVNEHVSH